MAAGVASAEGELGQHVALGEHSGDDALLVDDGDRADVFVHHRADCIFHRGQHRDGGWTFITPLQQAHEANVPFSETARLCSPAAGVKEEVTHTKRQSAAVSDRELQWAPESGRKHGNVEVHHFRAAGVAHAGEVDVRSLHWIADVLNVEKQEARLRGVRLDGEGAEPGTVELVELLLGLLVLVAPVPGMGKGVTRPGLVLLALT